MTTARAHATKRGGGRATGGLIAAFVAVCLCFVGSSIYADTRMREIAQRSREISLNAMPSIVELALIQKHLRLIDQQLDELSEGHDAPSPTWFDEAIASVRAAEARYLGLPFFPDEQPIWEGVALEVDAALAIAQEILERSRVGDVAVAYRRSKEALHPAVDRAEASLERLIAFDNGQGVVAAREVEATRARVTTIALGLDALSVLVTIAVALFAVRTTRRYSALLEERADELEAFSSRVAHDLRGPLTPAMLAFDRLGKSIPPDDPLVATVERGKRSLKMAESIVDALLSFARAGAKPAADARTGLAAAIADVVESARPSADAKGIALRIEAFDDVEVACARGALDSVVSNLVGNAIQNSPADAGCTIAIAAKDRVDRVRVEVIDTGNGLPPNVERAIFEPYFRARRGGGGLGLGLATVKRLVDAHHGAVGVRRNVERGCTFWFELPKAGRSRAL